MKNTLKNILIASVSLALIIFSINAFAHSGMGWHHSPGSYHQDGYYRGNTGRMAQEEYDQFEQNRDAFFKETKDIRDKLFEKNRELENELTKTEPNAAAAYRLQKEMSALKSQFDQKRIEHLVEMKKSNPNAGRGYMYGNRTMGGKSYRGGYCWQ